MHRDMTLRFNKIYRNIFDCMDIDSSELTNKKIVNEILQIINI